MKTAKKYDSRKQRQAQKKLSECHDSLFLNAKYRVLNEANVRIVIVLKGIRTAAVNGERIPCTAK